MHEVQQLCSMYLRSKELNFQRRPPSQKGIRNHRRKQATRPNGARKTLEQQMRARRPPQALYTALAAAENWGCSFGVRSVRWISMRFSALTYACVEATTTSVSAARP